MLSVKNNRLLNSQLDRAIGPRKGANFEMKLTAARAFITVCVHGEEQAEQSERSLVQSYVHGNSLEHSARTTIINVRADVRI